MMDGSYLSSHEFRHSTVTPDPLVSLLFLVNVQTSSSLSITGFPPISLALSTQFFSFSDAGREFPAPVRHVSSSCSHGHGACHEAVSLTEEREITPSRLRLIHLREMRELLYRCSLSCCVSVKYNPAAQRDRRWCSSSFARKREGEPALNVEIRWSRLHRIG